MLTREDKEWIISVAKVLVEMSYPVTIGKIRYQDTIKALDKLLLEELSEFKSE